MPRRLPVAPNCCAEVQQTESVSLGWTPEQVKNDTYLTIPPTWLVIGWNPEYSLAWHYPAGYCPCCGSKLPEIGKRRTTVKICAENDPPNGYCATCGDRFRTCNCYPAAYAWEPV